MMSSSEDNSCLKYTAAEKASILNTIEVLDEEKENILSEVLRCYVCLELPKGNQVRICEEGHHCCLSCHQKIKNCGICRGGLLESRNFVVEQLVAKLGPILGASKHDLPPAEPPKNLPSGSYPCRHECLVNVPAYQMLPHLRSRHSSQLLDNVRSNPYSGRFSIKLTAEFTPNRNFIWSTQVCDMGLFTTELTFIGVNFFGFVRMLADATDSTYMYQLVVKIPNGDSESSREFSVTNCTVASYLDSLEVLQTQKKGLKIRGEDLLEYINIGTKIVVFVSIWEKKNTEIKASEGISLSGIPERHTHFNNDRKIRRNRNRNMRRNRLKRLKAAEKSDESFGSCLEKLFNLAL